MAKSQSYVGDICFQNDDVVTKRVRKNKNKQVEMKAYMDIYEGGRKSSRPWGERVNLES